MAFSMGLIFKAMADSTRQRLLEVLSRQELSVSELVEVLGLPQSTISRHLKVLREAGLVLDRRVGAAVLHAARPLVRDAFPPLTRGGLGGVLPPVISAAHAQRPSAPPAAELRERLLEWAGQEPLDERTLERIDRVVRRRQTASNDFFERTGTRWDQLRIEAFGEAFHLEALTALLPAEWTVADIGSGTGYWLPLLAARFQRVIAVDPAGAMLEAARSRPDLKAAHNVEFREGSLAALPLEAGELDLAIASLVLHHVPDPPEAFQELRRVVRDGGRLLIIEQHEHGNDDFHERMGDYWRGFDPAQLRAWAEEAGFVELRVMELNSVRPNARNAGQAPRLFALTARTDTRKIRSQ